MFTPDIIQAAASLGSGFLFKMMAQGMQNKKEMFQMAMQRGEQQNKFLDAAAQRSNGESGKKIRRALVLFIMIMFSALIFMPVMDISTVVESTPQTKGVFWGLIEWSTKTKYEYLNGFYFPNELKQALLNIMYFYFGMASAKV